MNRYIFFMPDGSWFISNDAGDALIPGAFCYSFKPNKQNLHWYCWIGGMWFATDVYEVPPEYRTQILLLT